MATLTIDSKKIVENIIKLDNYLSKNDIQFTLVTKILCGYKPALEKIVTDENIKRLHSVGDARISNLKVVKEIRPDVVTMYIKPPAITQIKNVVKYADISFNSSERTIEALNEEASKEGKIHRVVVMIEMGELREGVLRDNILNFYSKIFNLPNIEVIGIGTNLGCMYGIEPTYDKLIQLNLYKLLIEQKFNKKLELVSAGSSITLPLLGNKRLPKGANHFRIGETAFLGVDLLNNKKFRNLSTNTINFSADILELEKKSKIPDGILSDASIGTTVDPESLEGGRYDDTYRAIVDFGELDVDVENLSPKDERIKFFGTTSDMTVYDLGIENGKYKVGGKLDFFPNYMAVARLMNSRYVTKKVM